MSILSIFGLGGGGPEPILTPSVTDLKRTFSTPSLGDAISLFGSSAGRRVWAEYQCQELGVNCPKPLAPETPAEAGPDPFTRLGDVLAGFGRGGGVSLPQPRQSATTVAYVPARTTQFNTFALVLLLVALGGAVYWYYVRKRTRAA